MVITLSGLLTFALYAFAAVLLVMASIAGTLLFTRLGAKPVAKSPVASLAKVTPDAATPAVALSPILSAIKTELEGGNVDAAAVLISHEAAKPKP